MKYATETDFLGAFKVQCIERGNHLYSTFIEKKSALAKRNKRPLKNIIYRYLEEKLLIHISTNWMRMLKQSILE